uniref:PWWP domain-containing protein n=1 Tax=Parascaris univalens TaxID=6257 RepID=A0A915BQ54_PARUN
MTAYQSGDLVWAKMKGFPPWPAKVLHSSTQLSDVPSNRYSIMFFGTKETAIMKGSDLFDYFQHRTQFEVTRKQKGFAEALQEIRVEAGLDDSKKRDSIFGCVNKRSPSPPSSILHANRVSGRMRRSSIKLNTDDFFLEPLERKRSTSRSSRRSGTESVSSPKAKLKCSKNEKKIGGRTPDRRRSESAKRNSFSFLDGLDPSDSIGDQSFSPMLCDGALSSLLDGLDAEVDTEGNARPSKRFQKQKAFEEFISSVRSPSRERSTSTSSSCRMRLISGMSDVFDELLESVQFNPAELLSAIDSLPSEEERPATPEEPLPLPAPSKRCSDCGCECELFGLKWRCTGKSCLKWNGTHNPFGSGEESIFRGMDALVPSSLHIENVSGQFAGQTDPKTEEGSTVLNMALSNNDKSRNWASIDVCLPAPSLQPKSAADRQTNPVQSAALIPSCSSVSFQRSPGLQECPPQSQNTAANERRLLPRRQLGTGRPKSYKVEKTPPVSENGQRHCAFCGGQVRPQMCGGNKHRWRCVDKKCRKWYGWVRSNEEIPKDLGKKGRWKDLALKIKPKGDSLECSAHCSSGSVGVPHSQNTYITAALPLCEKSAKKLGRPPKGYAKLKLKTKRKTTDIASENDTVLSEGERPKRKYTRRDPRSNDEVSQQSPCSPLPLEILFWQPSAMEQRGRWWTSEKRRHEMSPEREWSSQVLDVAAAMRLIGNAMNAAANTRADEPGTVTGTLDLLMDALMSSLGPILSLTAQVPQFRVDSETIQRLWNASAVHTPLFPS